MIATNWQDWGPLTPFAPPRRRFSFGAAARRSWTSGEEAVIFARDFAASHQRPQPMQRESALKNFLLQFFTWWSGQTLGTRFYTWRNGEFVGEDEFGNKYYRTRGGRKDPALGIERRWVIYNGEAEASMTPPGWNGWLHHTVDVPPTQEDYKPREWQKPHRPNHTGTPKAYRPAGSTLASGRRPQATGDYQAWSPGS